MYVIKFDWSEVNYGLSIIETVKLVIINYCPCINQSAQIVLNISLVDSDDVVQHSGLLGFGLCLSSSFLKIRKLNIPVTWSVSVLWLLEGGGGGAN
jgi:hypothetical protein